MGKLFSDVGYSLRQLGKTPAFTLTVILTLGLGIGVNTAMFSVIDQVLLRRLPFPDAQQLVKIGPRQGNKGFGPASLPDVEDWKTRSHSLAALAYWAIGLPTLGGTKNPQLVAQVSASANLFSILGVQPRLGRGFSPQDQKPGHGAVMVLSDRVWRSIFHANPRILGRPVTVNGIDYSIIGIMPPSFEFPANQGPQIFTPLATNIDGWQERSNSFLGAVGRLRPRISVAQAQQEMAAIHRQLLHEYPATETLPALRVERYQDVLTDNVRSSLYALDGAVVAVWLIACANIAGLMLTRTSTRRREIAIRGALGASRTRLAEQSLVESLLLGFLGGALGLGIAWGALRALSHYLPAAVPWGDQIHINAAMCAYLFLASCLSAVVFGLAPALYAARVPVQEGIREGSAGTGTSKKQARWRDALAAGEIALTLSLLIAAGLMLQTLWRLRHTDLGFSPENVATTSIIMPTFGDWWGKANAKGPDLVTTFYNPLVEKLKHSPGIESVGLATIRPFSSTRFELGIWPASEPKPAQKDEKDAAPRASTADYFKTMGIGLIQGRYFNQTDRPGAPVAVLVNEKFVRDIFHGKPAIGRQVKWNDDDKAITATVVGVIRDIHQDSVSESSAPEIYFDLEQMVPGENMYQILATFHMDVAVRTHLAAEGALSVIRRGVHELQPGLALQNETTMRQIVDDSLGNQTLAARLLTIFGIAAMVIATTGIYGLLAYSVSQRTRELGLRLALGAQRNDLLWMVLRHALALLGIGVGAGLAIAWTANEWLRSFAYGLPAFDGGTVLLVALILGVFGLAASYLPARRAANVDPIEALRTE